MTNAEMALFSDGNLCSIIGASSHPLRGVKCKASHHKYIPNTGKRQVLGSKITDVGHDVEENTTPCLAPSLMIH